MESTPNHETILRYVLGDMSESDRLEFGQQLATDPRLEQMVGRARTTLSLLEDKGLNRSLFDVSSATLRTLKNLVPASVVQDAQTRSADLITTFATLVYDTLLNAGLAAGLRGGTTSRQLSYTDGKYIIDLQVERPETLAPSTQGPPVSLIGRVRGVGFETNVEIQVEGGGNIELVTDAEGYFEAQLSSQRWSIVFTTPTGRIVLPILDPLPGVEG